MLQGLTICHAMNQFNIYAMKHTTWFFLLLAAFIMYSCSPDIDVAKEEIHGAAVRKTLNENELKKLAPQVYAAVDGIQQKNKYAYARGETASDSTYIIRTDRILEIQEKGWTCYTFSIERHPESRFTENLVITVDPDAKMYGRILNYDFTPADISNIQLGNKVDLSNKVTMTEVKDIATARRSAEDCVQISITEGPLCPSGQHDVPAMSHGDCDYVNDGSYTPGPAYVVTIIIDMSCFGSNDGGGEGLSNYGPGPSWGWSGGTGGLGGSGGATIGNNGGAGIGGNMGQDGTNIPLVLNPIKDINQDVPLLTAPLLLLPNPNSTDPCAQLQALSNDPLIKAKAAQVKSKVTAVNEWGFMLIDKPSGQTGPILAGVNQDDVTWPVMATDGTPLDDLYRWYGDWHNHLQNQWDHSGAFSPNDVRNLQTIGLIQTSPDNPYQASAPDKAVIFVNTFAGLFALKISDQTKLNAFNQKMYDISLDPNKQDDYSNNWVLNRDCYNLNAFATHDQTVIGMLRLLSDEDAGVTLFECSNPSNLTGWKELNLTENAGTYNFTEIPCN